MRHFKKNLQSLSVASCLCLLTACGGGNSDTTTPSTEVPSDTPPVTEVSETVTITALDGYLSGADVFLLDIDGQCSSDNLPLGITDAQGTLSVTRDDLVSGYCLITNSETRDSDSPDTPLTSAYMLYSPAPSLLGQDEAESLIISPFTSYLHKISLEADDAQTAIDNAIAELNTALDVEQEQLLGDFIASENLTLHNLAQILFDLDTQNATLSATATSNIINELASNVSTELTDTEISQLISLFMAFKIELDDENYDDSLIDVTDTTLLIQMPTITVNSDELKTKLDALIATGAESYTDTTGLVLENFELSGIDASQGQVVVQYSNADNLLTSIGVATIESVDESDTATYSNGVFTPDNAPMFNLAGDYSVEIFTKNTIDDTTFSSATVTIELSITETQLPNKAPVFSGIDSAPAQTILTTLQEAAADPFNTFDPTIFGLDSAVELSLSFIDISPDVLAGLFVESSDLQTVTYGIETLTENFEEAPELDDSLLQFGFDYSFTAKVNYPESGSENHDFAIFAIDELDTRSAESFVLRITVTNDNGTYSASVAILDGESEVEAGTGTAEVYGTPFDGSMVNALDTLTDIVQARLNSVDPIIDVNFDQLIPVYVYECTEAGDCKQGDGKLANYEFSNTDLLTILDGKIVAGSIPTVTQETIVTLHVDVNGDDIRLYTIDGSNRGDITVADLNTFGSTIELVITPDTSGQVTVTATVIN